MAFAEAIAGWDDAALPRPAAALVDEAGEAFMIDAAAVVANFEMMTRVADGTGAAAHRGHGRPQRSPAGLSPRMVERP